MIDQIAIRRKFGFELLDEAGWLALPKQEKIDLITDGRVEFLADGERVPLREALSQFQAAA